MAPKGVPKKYFPLNFNPNPNCMGTVLKGLVKSY